MFLPGHVLMNKLLQNNMKIKMFPQNYLFKVWKIIFKVYFQKYHCY